MTDFTFNEKTGELRRGDDAVIVLNRLHSRLLWFVIVANGTLSDTAIATHLGSELTVPLWREISRLNDRIKKLGMKIAPRFGDRYGSKYLVVGDMPKWQPKIAAPVVLEAPSR